MSLYMISYDLVKAKDYEKLFDEIKKISIQHVRPLKSMWIITCNDSAYNIATRLCNHIDADDKLIVNKLEADSSWTTNFGKEVTDWIQANF